MDTQNIKNGETKKELEEKIEEIKKEIENTKGTKCEIYSRVVGYHRPVENWNDGKKDEFEHRQNYIVHPLKSGGTIKN
ncbi:MAG: anaerobic ribonucleoside-triphosphate reductase [Deferribacterota bacterium]|nr:anaerobic ribonucleoside-triphosphate reductase [Deferribacterota bacterium]